MGIARHFAESFLRRPLTLVSVKKMKFTRVVVPSDIVHLTLTRKGETEIIYEYRKGADVCASGVMCFQV